jgi:hypothetical protein
LELADGRSAEQQRFEGADTDDDQNSVPKKIVGEQWAAPSETAPEQREASS